MADWWCLGPRLKSSSSVRGNLRPGARERRAGKLESRLGQKDGQETTMGLSLWPLSRVGPVGWLPAWEGMSSFIGREFEKKTKFSPSCKGSDYVYTKCMDHMSNTTRRQLCSSHGSGSFWLIPGVSCDLCILVELDIWRSTS